MKLEVGKTYLNRRGEEVEIVDKVSGTWAFISECYSYREDGRQSYGGEECELDLISEVVTERTLPRKVMVRDRDTHLWEEATLYAILPDNFSQRFSAYIEEDGDNAASYYKYMKEIESIPEFTMEEVIEKLGYEFKIIK